MGTARDLFLAGFVDSVAPLLRRPIEDLVYEILDRRRVPNHTEFAELEARVQALEAELASARKAQTASEALHHGEIEDLRRALRESAIATVEASMVAVGVRSPKESVSKKAISKKAPAKSPTRGRRARGEPS
jgi:hypothetical protein